MQEQDKARFEQIMRGLAENFSSEVTREGLRFRFAALQRFTIEQVEAAAYGLVAARKFSTMPTIAEFLEHIGGGRVEDHAEIEASKVWKAVEKHGAYANVCFDNPVTQAVIEHGFGGWIPMCRDLKVDEQKWFIKDFTRIYGAYARQNITHTGSLIGMASGEVVFIGDPVKAQAVLEAPQQQRGLSHTGDVALITNMEE